MVRVQEILAQDYQREIAYSTLTRWVREAQLRPGKARAGRYDFAPGEEMPHDTSPHRVIVGNREVKAQCASLVLAYSRRVYLQYYPRFTRFEAKGFLAEALNFMGGACRHCIVDNTSVVLAAGSGAEADIAPEMESFARAYGFTFKAHAVGDCNRKARVERPFHYAEHNFLVGRTFSDWDDLNRQAQRWCEPVANRKPKRELGMSPEAAYVQEKPHLLPLPRFQPPVFQTVYRVVDVEAYINLETNRYSVPEHLIGKQVEVQKHPRQVLIFWNRQPIAEHPRLIEQRHGKHTLPGHHLPLARARTYCGPCAEERALTGQSELLDRYVAALKRHAPGRGVRRLRRLLRLKQDYPACAFDSALRRALTYGMYDLGRLEQLILDHVCGDFFQLTDEDGE